MKFYNYNIHPSMCKFIVNKEKRTIICILDYTANTFIDFISANSHLGPETGREYEIFYGNGKSNYLRDKLRMPKKFIGIAHCDINDEWNEEIGRSIAFSRMKDKFNKSFYKRANTYFDILDRWLNETEEKLNKLGVKLEKNQQRRHEYINNLINKN